MKPLFMKAANGLVLIEGTDGYFNIATPDKTMHGQGCMVGENRGGRTLHDKFGRKFTGHWAVKPGIQVNHTLVTNWMNIPFDTTIHYIAVHLHPFAVSLELKDLTANRTVFKSAAKNSLAKNGLDSVDYFSSSVGLPIYKNHHYELISIYNNTSEQVHEAMAVMYLYLLDKEF